MEPPSSRLVGRTLNALLERRIRAAARYAMPILVEGESGSGKELVAWMIARLSSRRDGPYLVYNCGVVHDLIGSELFGHVKGSFTGATHDRPGIVESAQGGFVVLDEIDKLRRSAQAELLRVLSVSRVRRIGATAETPVDVRFIAATNADLFRRVQERKFSEDLYYRLTGQTVSVPPLRTRRPDIPELIRHFLAQRARPDEPPPVLEDGTIDWLTHRHDWPGNVRELEQWAEACWAWHPGESVSIDMARALLRRPTVPQLTPEIVEAAIRRCGGNRSRAARELKTSRQRLYEILPKRGNRT